ncbi:PTS ascorbate transporter subunit IIC [Clostridium oceanicum]|uniref:Ascorbate-specific PTS system EIIC component n=1 Tax=Clostridium oceanicum TaxID=1543 RepID=A0ABN1JJF4_9CLOT
MKIIVALLSNPTIIIGMVAFLGLVVQKKSVSDIIQGTLKVILGFIILGQGANIVVSALIPFSEIFTGAFGLSGLFPDDTALVGALQAVVGVETSYILLFSFLINLLIARITKYKYIFLTGHMMWYFSGAMAVTFYQLGFSTVQIIIFGSIIQGIAHVFYPAIAQPFVRKVIGNDNVAFGFFGSSLICFSSWLGGKFGNKDNSTEDLKVPDKLEFLKDMSVLMSIVMVIIFIVTAVIATPEVVDKVSGGQNSIQYSIMTGLTFVAGILVLLQGVRMFLAEIIPAFKGIAETIVPGAKPALDVPIFYTYAPTAVTIGFLSALTGGLLATFLSSFTGIVVLPAMIIMFFHGAAAGVFGNAIGGRRGAIVSGFLLGFLFTMLVALAVPFLDVTQYGINGLWFASSDFIFIIIIIKLISKLFGL